MPSRARNLLLGGFFVLIGALAVIFGAQIKAGFQSDFDPGPQCFPVALGIILLGGGLVEWARSLFISEGEPAESGFSKHSGLLFGGIVFYVALIPVLGLLLATLLGGMAMLRWLGASWLAATASAFVLVLSVYLLFQILFRVSLPSGMLGLPI